VVVSGIVDVETFIAVYFVVIASVLYVTLTAVVASSVVMAVVTLSNNCVAVISSSVVEEVFSSAIVVNTVFVPVPVCVDVPQLSSGSDALVVCIYNN